MEKFKQLGISQGILDAVKSAGFTEPSEIQIKTIPLVVAGKDVIGGSATGSGKTLAFASGIIDKTKKGLGIQALIMTPTRELAQQVAKAIRFFSRSTKLSVTEIYGGMGMPPQIRELRNADIVVGTPGRLLDHLKRRTINLNQVRFLVLDEADRMLDMGFIRDVEAIINHCPKQRQTLLFSATISKEIIRLADRYMKSPVSISVKNQLDTDQLYQAYYEPSSDEKFSLLVHLLKQEKDGIVMIFCNTRRNVDRLSRSLYQQKINTLAIHGGLSQNQRSNTMRAFHEKEALVLVCTDVAARGLDIKNVSHIYNFDVPTTPSEYIHRIGRTARAGKNGIAITFVSPGDRGEFKQIQKQTKDIEKLNIPKLESLYSDTFKSNDDRKLNRGRQGGGRGNRPSRDRPMRDRPIREDSPRDGLREPKAHNGPREHREHRDSRPRPPTRRFNTNRPNTSSRPRHGNHQRTNTRNAEDRNSNSNSRPPSRRFLRGKSKTSTYPRQSRFR